MDQIDRARRTYYTPDDIDTESALVISDTEYDRLLSELELLHEQNPTSITADFLDTVGVEQEPNTFPKVLHLTPMLSLDKEYDEEALRSWANGEEIIATPKYDGLSLSLIYESGHLQRAVTRGNGKEGADVTPNARMIEDIPQQIPFAERIEVRGEVLMKRKRFKDLLEHAVVHSEELPKSARNLAAGSLRQQDPQITRDRGLNFRAYQVIYHGSIPEGYISISDAIDFEWLKYARFKIPAIIHGYTMTGVVTEAINFWTKQRERYSFDIDGIVFRISNRERQKELGEGRKYPRYAKAFKWEAEKGTTMLTGIEWKTGKTGRVVPTGLVEPIELSSATVKRVTLHNAKNVVDNGLTPGDKINIQRSGEVIPKFLGIAERGPNTGIDMGQVPTRCPSCGYLLHWDGVDIVCNSTACGARARSRVIHYVQTVKMDGIGKGIIEKMFQAGIIRSAVDLYKLQPKDIAILPQMGKRSVEIAFDAIQSRRKIKYSTFLAALGCTGISTGTAEKLAEKFPTVERLLSASISDIEKLEGFAYTSAQRVFASLQHARDFIEQLCLEVELEMVTQTSSVLEGKTFVVTGSLSRPRDEIKELIKTCGGQMQTSVSSKTQFLVAGEGVGAIKLNAAKKHGTTILSEDEFFQMMP